MAKASEFIPALRFGHKIYPENVVDFSTPLSTGNVSLLPPDPQRFTVNPGLMPLLLLL